MYPFELPTLPYALDALQPFLSKETLEYHYGKHHAAYVNNLNQLLKDSGKTYVSLEEIITKEQGALFNNAAQIWNHTFYWNCLAPNQSPLPKNLLDAIEKQFGSFDNFKELFSKSTLSLFGSGWTWLVKNNQGNLEIINTMNAGSPITENKKPLLTCDIWEHAYYIDYRNQRASYIKTFWNYINWDFVTKQFAF